MRNSSPLDLAVYGYNNGLKVLDIDIVGTSPLLPPLGLTPYEHNEYNVKLGRIKRDTPVDVRLKAIAFKLAMIGACGRVTKVAKMDTLGSFHVLERCILLSGGKHKALSQEPWAQVYGAQSIKHYEVKNKIASDPDQSVSRERIEVPEWSVKISIFYIETSITPENIEKLLNAAGEYVGVGDWRPGLGGKFGTFKVKSLEDSPLWSKNSKNSKS